ncbi:MAG: protein rep [Thermosipho sp. (in: Bacteria)]|nr:protein rep [Thermosipho sp. (in: thermotogales)]
MDEVVIPAFERLDVGQAEKLKACGKYISVIECNSCATRHFAGFNRCKSRWCIPCNHAKVLIWVARLYPVLEDWVNKGGYVSMLNFTVRDMENLEDGIQKLNKSFRDLYNMTRNRKYWKDRFPGGIRSLEVKRGSGSGLWHPHFHCIVLQSSYAKDFDWLRERWEQVTSKNFGAHEKVGSVWIKSISGKHGILKAILETLKYIIKPEYSVYNDFESLSEMYIALKGTRQINTWGVLRGISRQVDEDIDSVEQKKLAEFVCRRCGFTKGEFKAILFETLKDEFLFDVP